MNRVVGGAHYGLRDWLMQRVSGVFMALYTFFLLLFALFSGPPRYAQWHALFDQPWMRYATLLFFFNLYLHAWVGVRDILMDYVPITALRLLLQVLVILALLLYLMWTIRILWGN